MLTQDEDVRAHVLTSLVAAVDDKTTRLWDAATGNQMRVVSGHTDAVTAVAFATDVPEGVSEPAPQAIRAAHQR
jgi:WD40 repeat protein